MQILKAHYVRKGKKKEAQGIRIIGGRKGKKGTKERNVQIAPKF